jgi:D-glycero-alpha-D-manno-heptose-7-phosphate kinase
VGSQDQTASAYGGLNRISFARDGEISVDPVTIVPARLEALQEMLLLFYTGTSRLASEIAKTVVANLDAKRAALKRMHQMVDEGIGILSEGALEDFGALLHEAWELKRSLAPGVETPVVDDVYRRALKAGALGGKLLGAGGSGFMVFVVPVPRQAAVIRALQGFLHVPFRFEHEGSKVIYYDGATLPAPGALPLAAPAAPRANGTRRRGAAACEARP